MATVIALVEDDTADLVVDHGTDVNDGIEEVAEAG